MTLVVAVIAVACVGLLSRRYTLIEFESYVTGNEEIDLERFAAFLTENYRQNGNWNNVQPLIERLGKTTDKWFILVDAERKPLAAAPTGLLKSDIQISPEHNMTWEQEEIADGARNLEQYALLRVPHADLRDAGGATVGTLYVAGAPSKAPSGVELFAASLNRTLLTAGAISAAIALLAAIFLSRRILRPVESLTAAVRQMEKGDLSRRVETASKDEIGELARAFNSMADNLARVERLRRNMVGDVAHELRTPLTNIRCHLEALQDKVVSPTPEIIDSLYEEALLLNRLIDDLQDLALVEAGQISLKPERLSVRNEAAQAVGAMRQSLENNGLTLRIDIPQDCPDVFADSKRFGQILRNLLNNAITHTFDGGKITVRARATGSRVEVTVEDTGSGIAAEDLPFVFERFYRADASRSRATGGAGLGLAIVRQIVEAHCGAIGIESETGRGTKIHFTLPTFAAPEKSPID